MSNVLSSEDFGLKIYNRFPPRYREDDAMENFALKKYLDVLADGGFKYSIEEINGILNLIDPDNVDAKFLPILFKQYGLEVFKGIPEQYLRYLLPKLGDAWSKKGSLSVAEFITSSLSGIKTSSNVVYDEGDEENPKIEVRLEMDYNIGDYFPEAEYFNRLLENFVPFFCDVRLLYSYLFYESNVLKCIEDSHSKVKYITEELGRFSLHLPNQSESSVFGYGLLGEALLGEAFEIDTIKDSIKQSTEDVGRFSIYGDAITQIISTKIIEESGKVRCSEVAKDIIKGQPSVDSCSFVSSVLEYPNRAIFGYDTMGEAVLGVGAESIVDYFEDTITVAKETDSITLKQNVDTLTNKVYNTLNTSFFTNSFGGYDIITIGNTKEVVF